MAKLSMKIAMLLALTTGHRMQTFAAINIHDIIKRNEKIEIKIPARIKTSHRQRNQPTLILPIYSENSKICVATTLQSYLKKTMNIRQNTKKLLLSYRKPHKEVSTQSISRWVKELLDLCGIDTSIFTAYSTRHASTSSVKRSGISIDVIKKTAGWTEASMTFARFYDLEIAKDNTIFATTVLEKVQNK